MSEKQKIAIIGGGASGLICGYLLSNKYEITLYEKKSILGGNVQTLNRNIKNTKLPKDINIENGVLGFSQNYYPNFQKLLNHLEVGYHTYKPSVSLFTDHQFYPARQKSYFNYQSLKRIFANTGFRHQLLRLSKSKDDFKNHLKTSAVKSLTFDDFNFSNGLYKKYVQALFMLSFSTPFHLVRQLPQTILNDYFLSLPNSTWFFVKGGVYAYMQDIIQKSKMQIICDAHDIKISRCENEVKIGLGGTFTDYHKVIIATTPGSVKNLLSDMTEQEHKIFRDFEDQSFKTMAHKDISIYNPYKSVYKTPMDLFYKYNSDSIGYNTYLNNVYKLQTKEHYNFAYNLDQDINKSDIIHKAHHIVPKYNLRHDSKMEILKHINGRNNTFFAGAYTSNGLHEGATISAIKISEILGGINIA